MNKVIDLPSKDKFKMNEVCGLVGVKPYVLRFWESEFQEISPATDTEGQKLYSQQDIESIALIKKLLFEDKMTIEKAKHEITLRMIQFKDKKGPLPLGQDISLPEEVEKIEELKITDEELKAGGLSEEEMERLVIAKSKIESMVSLTNSLKQTHHWN